MRLSLDPPEDRPENVLTEKKEAAKINFRMTRFAYFSFTFFRYWFTRVAAGMELVGEFDRQ
jgi:hypothetical protein